ncbi:MAG: 4Fe-4S ferredoxin [Deltaproteobacteria bacterium]|nr:4Fe-4S ferredoxin [Deltaproteobacteria bacterium]
MRIIPKKCDGCMKCVPFCSSDAIRRGEKKCSIDEDKCVECYVCLKSGICPKEAFEEVLLEWPRILRHIFSAPFAAQKGTGVIDGRGTDEMKTNDVTDRYCLGEVGFCVDVGRPGIGATFEDVEKISMAVAGVGVEFEPMNPIFQLMADSTTGRLRDDIKNERVLSCILEFKTDETQLLPVMDALKEAAGYVNTVFSVGCISRCRSDGTVPVKELLDQAGVYYRLNGKVNVGLGRRTTESEEMTSITMRKNG